MSAASPKAYAGLHAHGVRAESASWLRGGKYHYRVVDETEGVGRR